MMMGTLLIPRSQLMCSHAVEGVRVSSLESSFIKRIIPSVKDLPSWLNQLPKALVHLLIAL